MWRQKSRDQFHCNLWTWIRSLKIPGFVFFRLPHPLVASVSRSRIEAGLRCANVSYLMAAAGDHPSHKSRIAPTVNLRSKDRLLNIYFGIRVFIFSCLIFFFLLIPHSWVFSSIPQLLSKCVKNKITTRGGIFQSARHCLPWFFLKSAGVLLSTSVGVVKLMLHVVIVHIHEGSSVR